MGNSPDSSPVSEAEALGTQQSVDIKPPGAEPVDPAPASASPLVPVDKDIIAEDGTSSEETVDGSAGDLVDTPESVESAIIGQVAPEDPDQLEGLDALREHVGRQRSRALVKIQGTQGNAEIFNTPELVASAKVAVESNTKDVKATLEALERIKEYVGDVPAELAEVSEMYQDIYESAVIEVNGERYMLKDLDTEYPNAEKARQDEIDKIKSEGDYKYKFYTNVSEASDSSTSETNEITDKQKIFKGVDEMLVHLEAKLKDFKGSKEEKKNIQIHIRLLKEAKTLAKGTEGSFLAVAVLKALNASEIEGLEDLSSIIEAGESEESRARMAIRAYYLSKGVSPQQVEGIFIDIDLGNISDFLRNHRLLDAEIIKKIFGVKIDKDEKLTEFLNELLADPSKIEELKKRSKQVGLLAALLIIGSGMIGKLANDTAFGEQR